MKVIDLTHAIKEGMPVYPGTQAPSLIPAADYENDGFRETLLNMTTHTGTHIDAPAHIVPGRPTLDRLPASQFIGKALAVDCRRLREGEAVTIACLAPYGEKADRADFLLFNLGWDSRWGSDAYFGDYPCLDDQVMDYIIAGRCKGVGFDVIRLDPVGGSVARHRRLLSARDVVIIENLTRLDQCGRDLFNFSCFPLSLENADGSPVRAVAWFD